MKFNLHSLLILFSVTIAINCYSNKNTTDNILKFLKRNPNLVPNPGKRVQIVYSAVPHDSKAKYEFDDQNTVIYKPLVRFHKRIPYENKVYLNKKDPKERKSVLVYVIYEKLNDLIARNKYERSNEANDPLAPGNVDLLPASDEAGPKKKYWRPDYSLWNYWTYEKTIYADDCKGDLVKVAGICIQRHPI